ncbi:hypothetical protein J2Y48_002377 [Mycoplana sp. BE70]|nr:hypothetical protein [Mycoplana sp. BE70]
MRVRCSNGVGGDPERAGRLAALAAADGYPVRIRGRRDGRAIDERLTGQVEDGDEGHDMHHSGAADAAPE